MAQTAYYAKIDKPELGGGMYSVQFGWAKFAKKAKTASVATTLKTVKTFNYTWRSNAPKNPAGAATKRTSGFILGTTATVVSGMVRVTRATLGNATSGSSFWYELLGW